MRAVKDGMAIPFEARDDAMAGRAQRETKQATLTDRGAVVSVRRPCRASVLSETW